MPDSSWLADRDLRTLVAVIADARRDEPGPGVPWALLDGLLGLIRCDEVTLAELDLPHHRQLISQSVYAGEAPEVIYDDDDSDPEEDRVYWKYYRDFQAPADLAQSGLLGVIRWSDIYSPIEMRNQPLYAEYFLPAGKHALTVGLPTQPGHTRRLLLRRSCGRDFSDRDKLIAELIRPHLYEVYLDARRRREGIPRLTKREWQVLELAAQGNSNADIARLLFVSLSTVRKHMENIFERTGVRTRSAAVARMMPWTAAPQGR